MTIRDLKHIRYTRGPFTASDLFLTDAAGSSSSVTYHIQCPDNLNGALSEFYTLLIALQKPLEDLRAGIYHRTWSEINSFLSNQEFEHEILFPVPAEKLKECIGLYNQFAEQKQIRKAETSRLNAYNREGILAISLLRQKGELLCMHFYRLTTERAANLHAFTLPAKTYTTSHIGRAHRALHWLDITTFRQAQVTYYDFCGWYPDNTDAGLLNINKFKEQFGGHKVKEYTGVIYRHPILKILARLLR